MIPNKNNQKNDPKAVEKEVISALHQVYDPEIPVNIYELGLIYKIEFVPQKKSVIITMTLTSPTCPAVDMIIFDIKQKVELKTGFHAEVNVVFDPPWNKEMMSDSARLALNMF